MTKGSNSGEHSPGSICTVESSNRSMSITFSTTSPSVIPLCRTTTALDVLLRCVCWYNDLQPTKWLRSTSQRISPCQLHMPKMHLGISGTGKISFLGSCITSMMCSRGSRASCSWESENRKKRLRLSAFGGVSPSGSDAVLAASGRLRSVLSWSDSMVKFLRAVSRR